MKLVFFFPTLFGSTVLQPAWQASTYVKLSVPQIGENDFNEQRHSALHLYFNSSPPMLWLYERSKLLEEQMSFEFVLTTSNKTSAHHLLCSTETPTNGIFWHDGIKNINVPPIAKMCKIKHVAAAFLHDVLRENFLTI